MNTTTVLPGKFGAYGGQFVPEVLMPALADLERTYISAREDSAFQDELHELLATYVGRPTPLSFAARLTEHCGGGKIYLKREDLAHSGAHKINNALGQELLARPRLEPDSTAWPLPLPVHCSGCAASSTWARWIWGGRHPM